VLFGGLLQELMHQVEALVVCQVKLRISGQRLGHHLECKLGAATQARF
jgi:hypothetical protein